MLIEEMENHIIYFVRVNDAAMVERKETNSSSHHFQIREVWLSFFLAKRG